MIKRFIEDDEDWIAYLYHQIDKELNKGPKEQDWDRIEEYLHELDEACKGKYDPDPARKEEKLKELRELYRQAGKKNNLPSKRPRWLSGAIAACLLLVILGIPVASAAINHMSPVDVIRQWGKQFFNIPYDVPVEDNGITFVRHGDVIMYSSLEELLDGEDLLILYPTWLPEDVNIEQLYCYGQNESYTITFNFSDENISYSVRTIDEHSAFFDETTKVSIFIDGMECEAVLIEDEGEYILKFINEGLLYSIGTHDKAQLNHIVNCLHRREE